MRAFFLIFGLCLAMVGIVIFQSQPAFLADALVVAKLRIPYFALVIAGAAIGALIVILAIASLASALGKAPEKLWFIAEIVISLIVAAVLLFLPEKQVEAYCVSFGDYGPYCLKTYLYYILWIGPALPLLFGLIGLLRSAFYAVKNSGVVAAASDAWRSGPPPCPPGSESCPTPAPPRQIQIAVPANILQYVAIGAGVLLALFLLIFVGHISLYSGLCFFVGSFTLDGCFPLWVYILFWLMAIGLVIGGLFGPQLLAVIKGQGRRPG